MYATVKEHKELVRDMETGAILHTDTSVLKKHEQIMFEKKKQERLQTQIDSLKDDISEIKEMIRSLGRVN